MLHLPAEALAGCIMGAVERDTRGCDLDDRDRFNLYPATPLATISWMFEGEVHLVRDVEPIECRRAPASSLVLPPLVLSGPQRRPMVSWSPGPVHGLMVGFFPEALAQWLGRPVSTWVDQSVALEDVAPAAFVALCRAVLAEPGAHFERLQAGLLQTYRPPTLVEPSLLLADWTARLSVRVARTGVGRSLRQWQRRMRDWTGQTERDLQLLVRTQDTFIQRFAVPHPAASNLADLAAAAGFADQSHMGREIRRVTGTSPRRFVDRLNDEEAFWYYRLMARSLGDALAAGRD